MARTPKGPDDANDEGWFRREAKQHMERDVLPDGGSIKPVVIHWNLDGKTIVTEGGTSVLTIDMPTLRRESPEHYKTVYDLLILLKKQAWTALDAVSLVDMHRGSSGAKGLNQIRRDQYKYIWRDEDRLVSALIGKDGDQLCRLLDECSYPNDKRASFGRRNIAEALRRKYRMSASQIRKILEDETRVR
jgi:hypothetical protein